MIELLAVIAIIILVMSLALPNFVAMTRSQKWTAAVGVLQNMVMRARTLATSARKDISVEFDVDEERTWMWLEAESNTVERMLSLERMQDMLGGGGPVAYLYFGEWGDAGGRAQYVDGRYVNVTFDSGLSRDYKYGDNSRQSEDERLGTAITIDPEQSRNFINWDAKESVETYGSDGWLDIRIGTNGALVQTRDPVICLMLKARNPDDRQRQWVKVVRCTGRIHPAEGS